MRIRNGNDASAADECSAVLKKDGRSRRSRRLDPANGPLARRTLVLAACLCSAAAVRALSLSGGGRCLSPRRAPEGSGNTGSPPDLADVTGRLLASAPLLFRSPAHCARDRRRHFRLGYKDCDDDELCSNTELNIVNVSGRSPASASPLFVSPARLARDRRSRAELLNIIDSRQQVATRSIILSTRPKRKVLSKSKALFPTVVDRRYIDEELVSYDLLDGIARGKSAASADEEGEDSEAPAVGLKRVGKLIGKKKRKRVIVSNLHELHDVILDKGFELRDVELQYSPPPSLLTSKRRQRELADAAERPTSEVERPASEPSSGKRQPQADLSSLGIELEGEDESSAAGSIELEGDGEPSAAEWRLIGNVLAEDCPIPDDDGAPPEPPFSHEVLNLLRERYRARSTPASRSPNDTAKLALSIEGGGMRGAVSGGMAAAVACLGLSDAFDAVYGSSAGSVVGAYFVSRQLSPFVSRFHWHNVYTEVFPAGGDQFVKKSKIIGDVFRNTYHVIKRRGVSPLGKKLSGNLIERWTSPNGTNGPGANATSSIETLPPTRTGGLNVSFVLDSIMCPDRGLRPLDMEALAHNDAVQPLRIVSSSVELDTGKLRTVCFGSEEGHFRDEFGDPRGPAGRDTLPTDGESVYPAASAAADEDGARRGLWACLGASMLVPGAADSPFRLHLPSKDEPDSPTSPHLCFDAFCYEPVPFRSAVAEGATHVLALRSRPAGYEPKTRPTLYERAVAPLYFRSNGAPDSAAAFFERGGQQYLYAEDVLTCDRGLDATGPIPIPPAAPLYGAPGAGAGTDREGWARAHLLPIAVPADVPELSTLSQDGDDILRGMREGFAAAYDALAPVVGLGAGPDALDGMAVAELVFPDVDADAPQESVLEKQFPLAGEKLGESTRTVNEGRIPSTHGRETEAGTDLSSAPGRRARFRRLLSIKRAFRLSKASRESAKATASTSVATTNHHTQDADELLSFLPGLQLGTLPMV